MFHYNVSKYKDHIKNIQNNYICIFLDTFSFVFIYKQSKKVGTLIAI